MGSSAYPFRRPPRARAKSATGKLDERPNNSMLNPVPAMPVSRIGFRPILSLSRPHRKPVENSAIAKAEVTRDA